MKYYEVKFHVQAPTPLLTDACDVLSALAGEAGFESFENTDYGITGYVQQSLFQRNLLDSLLAGFPMEDVSVSYEVTEAEDRDWNQQWEETGFDPIPIGLGRRFLIHDGRHLAGYNVADYEMPIEIDARLAFGTGNHETTCMILGLLLDMDLTGKRVLDCGCGTGILSIAALMTGAQAAVGYDIDEWSVDNSRHNAVINRVDSQFTPLLGDATVLDTVEGDFDLVLANISRNTLLADMDRFCQKLAHGGRLVLSGFYSEDKPLLTAKASSLGLRLVCEKTNGPWQCLSFQKEPTARRRSC